MKWLLLFPHVPRTGGASLIQNWNAHFGKKRFLHANFEHGHHFFSPHTNKLEFYRDGAHFDSLIESLSQEQKRNIQAIGGHHLRFGAHRSFPQEPRYVAFFREPVARTVSLYNYLRSSYEYHHANRRGLDEWGSRLYARLQRVFARGGKIPSFEAWLSECYNQTDHFQYTMTRFLQELDYPVDAALFELLSFAGIAETYSEDVLYLSAGYGIRKFWAGKNSSTPHIQEESLSSHMRSKVELANEADFALYEAAKKRNRQIKEADPAFQRKLNAMRVLRMASYPSETLRFQLARKKNSCYEWGVWLKSTTKRLFSL